MKKKLISILLSVVLTTILITGCSIDQAVKTDNETALTDNEADESEREPDSIPDNETNDEVNDDKLSELEAISDVGVDRGLFEVKITLPADLFEETSQEDIELEAKEAGIKKVIFNDDGSITYIMDKATHIQMLDEFKIGIDESIDELLNGEDAVASFKEITYNDNMTEFTIKCDSSLYSDFDSFHSFTFFISGGMYQLFNGTDDGSTYVVVNFVDSETGEILNTADTRKAE